MAKRVTVSDLPDLLEQKGEFLYCRKCRREYSATRGDYWNLDPNKALKCCGVNMQLVRRECRLIVMK